MAESEKSAPRKEGQDMKVITKAKELLKKAVEPLVIERAEDSDDES